MSKPTIYIAAGHGGSDPGAVNGKYIEKALDDHNDRLTALEHRPSMWWDKLLSAGISAGVAAIISAIAAMIVR